MIFFLICGTFGFLANIEKNSKFHVFIKYFKFSQIFKYINNNT